MDVEREIVHGDKGTTDIMSIKRKGVVEVKREEIDSLLDWVVLERKDRKLGAIVRNGVGVDKEGTMRVFCFFKFFTRDGYVANQSEIDDFLETICNASKAASKMYCEITKMSHMKVLICQPPSWMKLP